LEVAVRIGAVGGAGAEAASVVSAVEVSGAKRGIEGGPRSHATVHNVVLRDNQEAGLFIGEEADALLVNATVVANGTGVLARGDGRVRNSILTENGRALAVEEQGALLSSFNDLFANRTTVVARITSGPGVLTTPVA